MPLLTSLQLVMPDFDDGFGVFSVVDEPQGEGLHALLGVTQF